ncbi:hypothetical protein D8674_000383 [Pyrus ussuriensis x Pyrus communis]|uniref:Uncharacterized protein n=1 Tax=Pyrus ussuriensis x Pyrus communis TaxID=2448454 RepID=A0A5N5F3X7_9ROSA|nr:hypothetical protein D8674_000383 [Pyrus ussuriensis x Pyrus communis]
MVVICEYGVWVGERLAGSLSEVTGRRWFRMGELGLRKIGKSFYSKRKEKEREGESKEWRRRLSWRERQRKERDQVREKRASWAREWAPPQATSTLNGEIDRKTDGGLVGLGDRIEFGDLEGDEVEGQDAGVKIEVEDVAKKGNEDDDVDEIKAEVEEVLDFENDEEPIVINGDPEVILTLDLVEEKGEELHERELEMDEEKDAVGTDLEKGGR